MLQFINKSSNRPSVCIINVKQYTDPEQIHNTNMLSLVCDNLNDVIYLTLRFSRSIRLSFLNQTSKLKSMFSAEGL